MIRFANKNDSPSLAQLHTITLITSFLAGLGISFLTSLYAFLIKKERVWVYEENNEIKGFVAFSENSAGMMKRFLVSCPGDIFSLVLKAILQPAILKRFWETFHTPFKSKKFEEAKDIIHLPKGELLSISVIPNCQAKGIGNQLVNALEDYLRQNQILRYKVIAGDELVGANNFYVKNGFVLANQIKIHGEKISNVYIKNI